MRELFRIVEKPRRCSYLPRETASLDVRAVSSMTPAEYGDLLQRGYRRFGWQVFRPACGTCTQCVSIRVQAQSFTPSTGHRRVLRNNEHIRAELHPLFVTREHIDLYNAYHRFMHAHRGWPLQQTNSSSYYDSFLSGAQSLGRQWLYFDADRLIGVAVMDEAPAAISLVYFFHDPEWRRNSPGVFSILNQLQYAKAHNADYAYLGYWIDQCGSMSYKSRFHPHELLTTYPADDEEPVWIRADS